MSSKNAVRLSSISACFASVLPFIYSISSLRSLLIKDITRSFRDAWIYSWTDSLLERAESKYLWLSFWPSGSVRLMFRRWGVMKRELPPPIARGEVSLALVVAMLFRLVVKLLCPTVFVISPESASVV